MEPMHRVVVVGAIVLAGCTGTFQEGESEAEPVSEPGSDPVSEEPIQLTIGGGQEGVAMEAGQQQRFTANVTGAEAVRLDVEVQRMLVDASRVEIEVRAGDDVLDHRIVYLTAIGGQGEVATENILVDVQGREELVVDVQNLQGAADVRVSAQATEASLVDGAGTAGSADRNGTAQDDTTLTDSSFPTG